MSEDGAPEPTERAASAADDGASQRAAGDAAAAGNAAAPRDTTAAGDAAPTGAAGQRLPAGVAAEHGALWARLRRFTPARIGLGRAGTSLPTAPQLEFQFAHARARDAVHLRLDAGAVAAALRAIGYESLRLHSAAPDRHTYLQRPDLGRRLDADSVARTRALAAAGAAGCDLALVVADGLSALAVNRHAAPFLAHLAEHLAAEGWRLAPVLLVEQGRVALGDEVGELLQARMVVVLIGERPGLSSPDSLGLYFTWAPRMGRRDAERNCISNVRTEGLGYGLAAHRLAALMREACRRQLSGVKLKDEARGPALGEAGASLGNFLLPPAA